MKIVVYCSSHDNIAPEYKETAAQVGQWIGQNNATLIYGGMNMGLMKIVADNTLTNNGHIVGVVPITAKSREYPHNHKSIAAANLLDRKNKMIDMGQVFIILAGGYGTLDELMSTFAHLSYTGNTDKTIILVNQNNLFDHTITQLEVMAKQNLFDINNMSCIKIASSATECLTILDSLKNNIQ